MTQSVTKATPAMIKHHNHIFIYLFMPYGTTRYTKFKELKI